MSWKFAIWAPKRNFLHKKIHWLEDIKNIFDKFLILQTKLDSFPDAQYDMAENRILTS